jgi:hypothetical protein
MNGVALAVPNGHLAWAYGTKTNLGAPGAAFAPGLF